MQILYDDKDLVVFEKSAGVDSEQITYRDVFGDSGKGALFCVHRLDREVGGVTVYAKNKETAAKLSEGFANRSIHKTYLAMTEGIPQDESGEMEDLLFHDRRINKTFVVDRERKGVKKALLTYEVLNTGTFEGEKVSIVKIRLQTGRSHQIRIQFASRKMPLAGDRRYGAKSRFSPGIALWSQELEMTHPFTGESLLFRSENCPFNKSDIFA